MSYGLHVLQFGKIWSYAGDVPAALVTWHEPTKADIMGGRWRKMPDGSTKTWKIPVFETREEAVAYARSKGFEPS